MKERLICRRLNSENLVYSNSFPLQFEDQVFHQLQRRSVCASFRRTLPHPYFAYSKLFLQTAESIPCFATQEYTHEAGLAGAFIFDSAGYKGASDVYKAIQKGLGKHFYARIAR